MRSAFIFLFALSASLNAATFRGAVTDSLTHDALVGATVVIVGSQLGTTTGISGNFEITNIPLGQFTIKTSYIGYIQKTVTITVSSVDEVVNLNLALFSGYLPFSTLEAQLLSQDEIRELNEYQDSLSILAQQTKLITIIIDSLELSAQRELHGVMIAHLTIINNTTTTIYLFPESSLRLHPIITDSAGKNITPTIISDAGRYFVNRFPSEFILLPGKTRVRSTNYNFAYEWAYIPNGLYNIHFLYSYALPQTVYCSIKKQQLINYLKALRGSYMTDNAWRFVNSKSQKNN